MPTPSEIQTCINNLTASNESIDFITLAAETNAANTGISFSVATVNDLPDLETSVVSEGQIYFVESIGVPVIKNENKWMGLDGRILRKDFDIRALFSWGINTCGSLGTGALTNSCSPTREFYSASDWCQVSASTQTSSAIKTTGELWIWGNNGFGQLGDGTTITRCSPIRELCSATDWCRVDVSCLHSAAIKTTGQIWSWGFGGCGRLGDGTTISKCSPVRERCSATDWCYVATGSYIVAGIKTSGELWTWGDNSQGQLGDGTLTAKCSPVRESRSSTTWCQVSGGAFHTTAINTSGELWSWGLNIQGQLGIGTCGRQTIPQREFCSSIDWCQVDAGQEGLHTLAIKTSGQLWSWGYNNQWQLGDGTATNRSSPVREISSSTDWCQAGAGCFHGAAIKTTGQLWSWGSNQGYRLGTGFYGSSCSPVREFSSSTTWCNLAGGRCHTLAIRIIQ